MNKAKLNVDIFKGKAGKKVLFQPRICCWYSDKEFLKQDLPGELKGMNVPQMYKSLDVSNRIYDYNACFERIYDESVKTDWREIKKGEYKLTLSVYNKVGASKILTHVFTVEKAPVDPLDLKFDPKNPPVAYPNPGTAGEAISFKLNLLNATGKESVTIRIFDFAGKEVVLLPTGTVENCPKWDGRSASGGRVVRGTYFARVTVNNGTKIVEAVVKVAVIN